MVKKLRNGSILQMVVYAALSSTTSYPFPYPLRSRNIYAKSSIRDSGVNAIESLMERRGAFDYILLETSGLADPGNIAPLFWVDDGLGSTIYLDGIVTVIDAKNTLRSLDEPPPSPSDDEHQGPLITTAHLQISHADIIILNKIDVVSAEELQKVKARVQAINSLATIHETQYGQIPELQGLVLDLHAYDDVGTLDIAEKGHSHVDEVCVFSVHCLRVIPSGYHI